MFGSLRVGWVGEGCGVEKTAQFRASQSAHKVTNDSTADQMTHKHKQRTTEIVLRNNNSSPEPDFDAGTRLSISF